MSTKITGTETSNFWLGKYKDEEVVKGDRYDIVRLAAYKKAISNFVRIVTGKSDIPVKFSTGKDSYTNGKYVVISAKIEEKQFDCAVGLALHEASHVLLTDFNAINPWSTPKQIEEYLKTVPDSRFEFRTFKNIVNVIEDRRIDRFIYDNAPGYRGYYEAMYNKYFFSKDIDTALKAGRPNRPDMWDDYMFHIINLVNPNINLDVLPALREVSNLIDIPNISRLTTTSEVAALSATIYITIDKAVRDAQAKLKAKKSAPKKPKLEVPKASAGSVDKDNLDLAPTSVINNPDSDTEAAMETAEVPKKPSNKKEQTEKSEEDAPTAEEVSDAEITGNTEVEIETEAEDDDIDEGEGLPKQLAEKIVKELRKQQIFLDGKVDKKNVTQEEAKKINAAESANASYETVGDETVDLRGTPYKLPKVNCIITRGLSKEIYESGLMTDLMSSPKTLAWKPADVVVNGINLGTLLGKRLKTRDENRTLATTRLDTGKIDRRLISELGFGNPRVFTQIRHFEVKPIHIHISIDASGSMSGAKWRNSMTTAIAIAKAASMTTSMEVVITVRGTMTARRNSDTPLMWKIYDSRKDNFNVIKTYFPLLNPTGSTPEGLCFQAIQKEIISDAKGKESYFINISDGAPAFSNKVLGNYSGIIAYEHTRKHVEEIRNSGINVLSYFVSDSHLDVSTRQAFQKMYGESASFIDVTSLAQLSKSLNQMFERKQG